MSKYKKWRNNLLLGALMIVFGFQFLSFFAISAYAQTPPAPPPPPTGQPPQNNNGNNNNNQNSTQSGTPNRTSNLIPCSGPDCDYKSFIKLIQNIIDFLIKLSVPVATGVIAWAGFTYMTTGISDKKNDAKNMLQKVVIGFAIIFAAWLIVSTILKALLKSDFLNSVPLEVSSLEMKDLS